jgi:D-alanine transaminase
MREKGIHLLSRPDIRWDHCDIKSTNLLANVLAIQESKEAGCQEVLFYLKDGTITESAHSSLFGVLDGTQQVRQYRIIQYPQKLTNSRIQQCG